MLLTVVEHLGYCQYQHAFVRRDEASVMNSGHFSLVLTLRRQGLLELQKEPSPAFPATEGLRGRQGMSKREQRQGTTDTLLPYSLNGSWRIQCNKCKTIFPSSYYYYYCFVVLLFCHEDLTQQPNNLQTSFIRSDKKCFHFLYFTLNVFPTHKTVYFLQ